jgi:hypothetical protein
MAGQIHARPVLLISLLLPDSTGPTTPGANWTHTMSCSRLGGWTRGPILPRRSRAVRENPQLQFCGRRLGGEERWVFACRFPRSFRYVLHAFCECANPGSCAD